MTTFDIEILKAGDPAVFFQEVTGLNPDSYQKQLMEFQNRYLILNCARQWGKSTTISAMAYLRAKYSPKSLILILSHSQRQSMETFRKILEMTEIDAAPLERVEDSKQYMTLSNRSRIISLPDKEGSVRGYSGVNLLIIDEASWVSDDLFGAVSPMITRSRGDLYLLSSPHGKRGFFFNEWYKGSDKWKRYQITAPIKYLYESIKSQLKPPPEDAIVGECWHLEEDFIKGELKSMPLRHCLQEYFCEFVETEDQVFSHDLIQSMLDDSKPLFAPVLADMEVMDI